MTGECVIGKGVFWAFFRLIRLDYSFFSALGIVLSGLLAGDLVGFQLEYLTAFFVVFFSAIGSFAFNDYFDLYLGKDNTNVDVKIYSSLGNLIWLKNDISQNESIRINTSNMARGVYYVLLKFETYQSTIKIIKE